VTYDMDDPSTTATVTWVATVMCIDVDEIDTASYVVARYFDLPCDWVEYDYAANGSDYDVTFTLTVSTDDDADAGTQMEKNVTVSANLDAMRDDLEDENITLCGWNTMSVTVGDASGSGSSDSTGLIIGIIVGVIVVIVIAFLVYRMIQKRNSL